MTPLEIATAQESSGWRIWSSFPSHNLTVRHVTSWVCSLGLGWVRLFMQWAVCWMHQKPRMCMHRLPSESWWHQLAFERCGVLVPHLLHVKPGVATWTKYILLFLCRSHRLHSFGDTSETCLNTCLLSTRSTKYVRRDRDVEGIGACSHLLWIS